MGTKYIQAQDEVLMCLEHEGKRLEIYCKSCKSPGCLLCARSCHQTCDWETLDKNARNRRIRLPYRCKELRNKEIKQIQNCIKGANDLKTKNEEICCDVIERIKIQKVRILDVLDTLVDQMIRKYEQFKLESSRSLDRVVSKFDNEVKIISSMIDSLEQNQFRYSNKVLVEMDDKVHDKLEHLLRPEAIPAIEIPLFTEGEINVCVLKSLLGFVDSKENITTVIPKMTFQKDISHITLSELSRFSIKDEMVSAIQPVSENHAWMHSFGSGRTGMFTINGSELRMLKIGFPYDDCVILKTGIMVLTTVNGVKQYDMQTGRSRDFIVTLPLFPLALCKTLSEGYLVTLVDVVNYETKEDSKRLVLHYSLSGKVRKTYHLDNTGKRLFTLPYRVKQNFNCNVCVIDRTAESRGSVVVLQENGKLRFRYTGQELDRKLDPYDLSCDENCNIIISDVHNHAIHLISPMGKFLKFLFIPENGFQFPISLALGFGKLWIGCWKGRVHVFEYSF